MKSEGVKILIHEAIIASWMRIGKPYKKEERTNQCRSTIHIGQMNKKG